MKNRNLQNKRLDAIGNKLLKAALPPDERIEKIVGNPRLFSAITARIETEKSAAAQESVFVRPQTFALWNRRKMGFAFGILLILSLATTSWLVRRTTDQPPKIIAEKVAPTKSSTPILTADSKPAPSPAEDSIVIGKPKVFKSVGKTLISQKIVKRENAKAQKMPTKEIFAEQPPLMIPEEQAFYPLAVSGNQGIENGSSQIVRTELSRAALFALGVNVSAGGDESRKYKTDLLVGADGVPQAIRFVE